MDNCAMLQYLKMSISFFIVDMEAECSDDVMKMTVKFNDTFKGLIYSAGNIHKTQLKIES